MRSNSVFLLVNILSLAAVVVVNYLSNSLPLNGRTPGQLSDLYPNLFVPAITFSIWGVIYLLLLIWASKQVIALLRQAPALSPDVAQVRYHFVYSCLLNISWLFAWHWQQLWLSVALMVSLLTVLYQINQRLQTLEGQGLSKAAFGLYQGWITVALIANITALLVALGWNGGGMSPAFWAITMIGIGGLLAVYMVTTRHILFHGVAVSWAFLGIYLKRNQLGDAPEVTYAALLAATVVGITVVLQWWPRKKQA
jgi:translocator protein